MLFVLAVSIALQASSIGLKNPKIAAKRVFISGKVIFGAGTLQYFMARSTLCWLVNASKVLKILSKLFVEIVPLESSSIISNIFLNSSV